MNVKVFLRRPRASWNEVGLFLLRKTVVCFTQLKECRWPTVCCFVRGCGVGLREDRLLICVGALSPLLSPILSLPSVTPDFISLLLQCLLCLFLFMS